MTMDSSTDSACSSASIARHAPVLVAVLAGVNIVAVAAALILPRLVPASGDGLTDGATAALAFFGAMAIAVIAAVAALIISICYRRSLSGAMKWLGVMLLPMNILVVAGLFVYAMSLNGT